MGEVQKALQRIAVVQNNLNALAALLVPNKDTDPHVGQVFSALAQRSVEWPPDAVKALDVPNLHENAQVILIAIAAELTVGDGRPVQKSTLASLRNRMNRYHAGWRD